MSAEFRRARLLEQLQEQGAVQAADLVARFGVSDMTIRRDLRCLEQRGLLRRVRGGAIQPHGRSYEPPRELRQTLQLTQKEQIATVALGFVEDGDSLTLDTGTTTYALARQLMQRNNFTVLTPSLLIADLLSRHPSAQVIVSGGVLRQAELSMTGPIAARTFSDFYVDKLFLGVGGVHPDQGFTEFNSADARVKQAMLEHAKEITVLADSTKLGATAFALVAPLTVADRLITDDGADPVLVARIAEHGVDVVLASNTEQLSEEDSRHAADEGHARTSQAGDRHGPPAGDARHPAS